MTTAVDTLEKLSDDPDVQRQARDLDDARLMYQHAIITAPKQGRAEAHRDAVCRLCRALGLELGAQQEDHLATLNVEALTNLLSHLEQHRALPEGF